jgi:hypothetical protein
MRIPDRRVGHVLFLASPRVACKVWDLITLRLCAYYSVANYTNNLGRARLAAVSSLPCSLISALDGAMTS